MAKSKDDAKPVKVLIGPKAMIQAPIIVGEDKDQDVGVCQVPLASLSDREFAAIEKLIIREAQRS